MPDFWNSGAYQYDPNTAPAPNAAQAQPGAMPTAYSPMQGMANMANALLMGKNKYDQQHPNASFATSGIGRALFTPPPSVSGSAVY